MAGTLDFYNYDIEANGVISQKQQQAKIDSAQNEKSKELEQVGGYPPEGGIPATNLDNDVQSSLSKADAAYQKPSNGIPAADLASGVRTSLGKADTAYQKSSQGIPKTDLASGVQTSLGKADTAYQKPSDGIPKTDLDSSVQESLNNAGTQCYLEGDPETPVGIFDSTQSNLNVIDSSSSGCALYLWLSEQDMNSGEVQIILPSVRQLGVRNNKVYNSIYIVNVQQGSSLFCSLPISDESIGLTKIFNSAYYNISLNPGLYEVNCMFASGFWFINACLITTP